MNRRSIGDDICRRFVAFANGAIAVAEELPSTRMSKHIADQLVRASTGGGSSYEEARGAESRRDFIHKLSVANKETREAKYWLELIEASGKLSRPLTDLIAEADELVSILTASRKTARDRE